MIVVTRLSPSLADTVTRLLDSRHRVYYAAAWDDLCVLMQQHPIDVIILDPADDGDAWEERNAQLRRKFPGVACVAYTAPSPEGLQHVAGRWMSGIAGLAFHGLDDHAARLSAIVERAVQEGTSHIFLERVGVTELVVPPKLWTAILELFRNPRAFGATEKLAERADLSRRTLDRLIRKTPAISTGRLMAAAELLYVFDFMQLSGSRAQKGGAECRGPISPSGSQMASARHYSKRP
jgi:hypothetical protein